MRCAALRSRGAREEGPMLAAFREKTMGFGLRRCYVPALGTSRLRSGHACVHRARVEPRRPRDGDPPSRRVPRRGGRHRRDGDVGIARDRPMGARGAAAVPERRRRDRHRPRSARAPRRPSGRRATPRSRPGREQQAMGPANDRSRPPAVRRAGRRGARSRRAPPAPPRAPLRARATRRAGSRCTRSREGDRDGPSRRAPRRPGG